MSRHCDKNSIVPRAPARGGQTRALRPREAGRRPRGVSTPGGSACRDVCARGRARVVRVSLRIRMRRMRMRDGLREI